MEVRWITRLGPPLAVVIALAAVIGRPPSAAGGTWDPPPCQAGSPSTAAALPDPATPGTLAGRPWFRLDPELGRDASLVGQRLSLGRIGDPDVRIVALPAESSVSGPVGSLVAIAADDGHASELSLVDLAAGCRSVVGREDSVVRRLAVDPSARWLLEARVDRATRTDLGIWRRPLDGGVAARLVAPLERDPRFGRTFSTELSWDLEGRRLVVESCGPLACRFRLVDPDSGAVTLAADPLVSGLVGVSANRIVAFESCRGLPCPLVSLDATTGRRTRIADAAGLASLVSSGDGVAAAYESAPGIVDVVDVASGAQRARVQVPTGLRLVPSASRAAAWTALPSGWLLLSADGRGFGSSSTRPLLLRPEDGRIARIPEVRR